jgi:hypothetical protein
MEKEGLFREYSREKYHCTIDLLFDWFGISCMTTANICFYLQNRLIQTSQTGGQRHTDTSPFSIPWIVEQRGRNTYFQNSYKRNQQQKQKQKMKLY